MAENKICRVHFIRSAVEFVMLVILLLAGGASAATPAADDSSNALYLKNGYAIRIIAIDQEIFPYKLWLALEKDGIKFDDKILNIGEEYLYKNNDDMVKLKVEIFANSEENIVIIKNLQQISKGEIVLNNENFTLTPFFSISSAQLPMNSLYQRSLNIEDIRSKKAASIMSNAPKLITVDDDGRADYLSIQRAIDAANTGDTIYVHNGTYYERLLIMKDNLTILGENKETTIIDNRGEGGGIIILSGARNNTIENITIRKGEISSRFPLVLGYSRAFLKENYSLMLQSIDAKASPRQAWVTLSKNGSRLDDRVIFVGETYNYVNNSTALILSLRIDNIFAGTSDDYIKLINITQFSDINNISVIVQNETAFLKVGVNGNFSPKNGGIEWELYENYSLRVLDIDVEPYQHPRQIMLLLSKNEIPVDFKMINVSETYTYYKDDNLILSAYLEAVFGSTSANLAKLSHVFQYSESTASVLLNNSMNLYIAGSPRIVKWQLFQNYSLTVMDIDSKVLPRQVWLRLSKDDVPIEDKIIQAGDNFIFYKNNLKILNLSAGTIFDGTSTDFVIVSKIYQYSDVDGSIILMQNESHPYIFGNFVGIDWGLFDNYTLSFMDADMKIKPAQAWLRLKKNGIILEDSLVAENHTYSYTNPSESHIFDGRIDKIFSGNVNFLKIADAHQYSEVNGTPLIINATHSFYPQNTEFFESLSEMFVLYENYTIIPVDISVKTYPRRFWLRLYKNGDFVDEKILEEGQNYSYHGGGREIISTKVVSVFAGTISNLVQFHPFYQYSEINGTLLMHANMITLVVGTASFQINAGITLDRSTGIKLQDLNILNNLDFGIFMSSSGNNTLSGNNASYNNINGIRLVFSINNTLSGNSASSNRGSGIYLMDSSNNILNDNNALNSGIAGIRLYSSSNNTLSGNNASNNNIGVSLYIGSGNNNIHNNLFNNIKNFEEVSDVYYGYSLNKWNIIRTNGTSIIGGPYLGGNFWANPSGTGFSQTCSDSDKDGICDSPYTLGSNNIDYLPLATNTSESPRNGGATLIVNASGGGDYTRIQDAIDNANESDLIYVHKGTYKENIVIFKQLTLKGEDSNNTIIDGMNKGDAVYIEANNVNISGFKIINGRSDYPVNETEIRGSVATGSFIWDNSSFAGFFYDVDNGLGMETLKVVTSGTDGRSIGKSNITYNTTGQPKQLKVVEAKYPTVSQAANAGLEEFGDGDMASVQGNYTIIGWQGEKYAAIRGKDNKLSKLLIEHGTSSAEKKTLTVGETWEIGGGFTLIADSIDSKASPRQVWLTLKKDGVKKDDKVVTSGSDSSQPIYTYVENSLCGETDVPVLVLYVDNVFTAATKDMVQFRYTWLISPTCTEVKSGDVFGSMKVTNTENPLTLENSETTLTLSRDSTVDVVGDIKLKVADSASLRYYPYVLKPGTYEVRGRLATGSDSWDNSSFAGFLYDIDYNIGTETLTINVSGGTSIAESNMTYTAAGQQKQLKVVEAKYSTNSQAQQEAAGLEEFSDNDMATVHGNYTIIGWLGKKYVAIRGKSNKLSKLLIEHGFSYAEKKTLTVNDTWELGGGYALTATAINVNANPRQVRLTLYKDGVKKDDKVVTSGGVNPQPIYTYVEKSLGGETDVPVFVTYVDSIFAGATTNMVQFRYTWFISDDVNEIKTGDGFGKLKVVAVTKEKLVLKNKYPFSLDRGSIINIIGDIKLRVADSAELRYFPALIKTRGSGIKLDKSENSIISDINAANNWNGISLWFSDNNTLSNNNVSNNSIGIILTGSSNNTLSGNTVRSNYGDGGLSLWEAHDNIIYNNIFNNTNNIRLTWTNINTLNITRQSGTNIIGGSYLGGNFWAYPNGTGFSQTCSDNDKDDICDSPYTFGSNNIDYLPLTIVPQISPTPAPTSTQSTGGGGSSRSSGGGGGGGGAPSDEDFKNIEKQESRDAFVQTGSVIYRFTTQDILNEIGFDARKSEGLITAKIELLRSRPKKAAFDAPGSVYRYFNVVVGTSGYGTSSKLENAYIVFRIPDDWLKSNNLDSVKLMKFMNGTWIDLKTERVGEDTYKAFTPGFSGFAITGTSATVQITPAAVIQPATTLQDREAQYDNVKPKMDLVLIAGLFAVFALIALVYFRKKQSGK